MFCDTIVWYFIYSEHRILFEKPKYIKALLEFLPRRQWSCKLIITFVSLPLKTLDSLNCGGRGQVACSLILIIHYCLSTKSLSLRSLPKACYDNISTFLSLLYA